MRSTIFAADPTLEGNIMAGLYSLGVTEGWDPTQTTPNTAFSNLNATFGSTTASTVNATYKIPMETYTNVTKTQMGVLTSGFRYGIAPNNVNWNKCPVPVPEFAPAPTAGIAFPSGFEVVSGGISNGRKILLRSVWVAEGATSPRAVYNDMNLVVYARDSGW